MSVNRKSSFQVNLDVSTSRFTGKQLYTFSVPSISLFPSTILAIMISQSSSRVGGGGEEEEELDAGAGAEVVEGEVEGVAPRLHHQVGGPGEGGGAEGRGGEEEEEAEHVL